MQETYALSTNMQGVTCAVDQWVFRHPLDVYVTRVEELLPVGEELFELARVENAVLLWYILGRRRTGKHKALLRVTDTTFKELEVLNDRAARKIIAHEMHAQDGHRVAELLGAIIKPIT
jgi:hypothetical protein